MTMLASFQITTSSSAAFGPTWQVRNPRGETPKSLSVQANFIYGTSGGTSVNAYLQTSLDHGANWCDVASFAFATGSTSRLATLVAASTQFVSPANMALASSGIQNGILGAHYRVAYVSVGTYSTACFLNVDVEGTLMVASSGVY